MNSQFPDLRVLTPTELDLPEEVAELQDLAYNLWWSWNPEARRLFSSIDPWSWRRYRSPVAILQTMDQRHWEPLLEDDGFLSSASAVLRRFSAYMAGGADSWFARTFPGEAGATIAYASTEYGLYQALPIYSGGLGILSGDHTKSASDLGLPLVGIGLLYRSGYFRQAIDAEGIQQHIYPEIDFSRAGARPVLSPATGSELIVRVPFPDRDVRARVWALRVGRVWLLLLDTDTRQNDPADRPITRLLYVRGREMRLAQEMVLGVGGVLALRALGIQPTVWHLNEGHSSFLQLERIAHRVAAGAGFDQALGEVRASSVFTTHTPVPAGNETFDEPLARTYLERWSTPLGVGTDQLLALGHATDGDPTQQFNLTALALRTSRWANGVSKLNSRVSTDTWRTLLGEQPGREPVIHPVTNGVHLPTWLGAEMRELWVDKFGAEWSARILELSAEELAERLSDAELWQAHLGQKQRLIRFARKHLRQQLARHGRPPAELREVDSWFDPAVLTVGFARRFATYKRARLLFSDLQRVRKLLTDEQRPVQVLFSGKAHPADRPGQELIRHIFLLSKDPEFRGRICFLEDYDLNIGRMLVQGVDVWLNTPRVPLEASGTSGMKAAMNGVLNLSMLDGWWPEAFDGTNGWSIDGGRHDDEAQQDHEDAAALYALLETEVVPAYYDHGEEARPRQWIERMRRSVATTSGAFSSDRMVRDYTESAYLAGVQLASQHSSGEHG